LLIGPMKMEFLDESISLVHIHDLISDKVIDEIQERALSSVDRSKVQAYKVLNPLENVLDARISTTAFLADKPIYRRLSSLFEKVTQLKVLNEFSPEKKPGPHGRNPQAS